MPPPDGLLSSGNRPFIIKEKLQSTARKAQGIKNAGSLSANKVADAIRKLEMTTPLGEIQYQANGDLQAAQIYIFEVQGGEFVQVAP